ncbi:uncharacterized protein LOC100705635 isoform X1 [Oreochromis niloticus]|uniref:uncharacterized protein LOC100705635 isoform X1 n=1 Tax=Oreochromis niloticus TaxID=8128 RepID=UPI000905D041|nr:uncharacterized protein LOC100705635 isoform X1 [Oreochromis niloticus]
MKMLLPLLLLVLVSQHALAQVVEVYEGQTSVLLPCKYSGFIPEDSPTVLWTRSDLNPKSVHLQREKTVDLKGQNQHYRNRTSMRPDALDTLDFSLTLRNPQMTDSSIYTCSIGNEREELKLTDIQLHVKDQQVEVKVEEGSDSVTLPCNTTPDLPEDTTVKWTHFDQELTVVQVYSNKSDHLKQLDNLYCGRAKMNEDLLRTGDLSLTLKYPTKRDSGGYICIISRDKDILRQKVVLQVKDTLPSWAKALVGALVLFSLALVVFGGLLFKFWHKFMSVIPVKVEVEEGVESVTLPFKTTQNLSGEIQVIWERYKPFQKAYKFENKTNQVKEQHEVFKGRTVMNENFLETGDLSLTLKQPTKTDSGKYKCLVWREGTFIRMKTVKLKVKDCQVQFKQGEGSVTLPFKTKQKLSGEIQVIWEHNEPFQKAHVFTNCPKQYKEQHEFYRDRTVMNKDLLETGDLSLTLKQPTDGDSGEYKCFVWRKENFIRMKTVKLKVKVCQVEVEEGEGSVTLPFKTTENLLGEIQVIWERNEPFQKAHVFTNNTNQVKEQHEVFKGRTVMNENFLVTGDLSLTLKQPTKTDSGEYKCLVWREGTLIRKKTVLLKVKVCQVEVEEGEGSVTLPFKTTENLLGEIQVIWERNEPFQKAHVFTNNTNQVKEQHEVFKGRTVMNENFLVTGDLSLTLQQPTKIDSGKYKCLVWREGTLIRKKPVLLKVKDCEVEVGEEVESVQLPFKTTENLSEGIQVIWERYEPFQKAYMFKNNTNPVEEQHEDYRLRTVMNEDPLNSGDLSLTMKKPTKRDRGEYKCLVWREGNLIRKKPVLLKVKDCQVQFEQGAESVQLALITTQSLPENA